MRNRVHLGNILSTYGKKGILKVLPVVDDPKAFTEAQELIVFGEETPFVVESIVRSSNVWHVKFRGIDAIGQAKQLIGRGVYRDGYQRVLDVDEYYVSDLIGVKVIDMQGLILGTIAGVDTSGYQDLLIVETSEKRQVWVPFVHAFVQDIDLVKREIKLSPIEGMFS